MRPLEGVLVLDFSRVLAAPMGTQLLADLGAEVIKVERPHSGDETRNFEPKLPGGESAYFFAFNRGKKSVVIDLKKESGRDIARGLACQADVLVENFLPGKMNTLGLDYNRLSEINPQLIYLSNTGFGQTGPYRDRKGYDTIFQALSGLMDLTGYPEDPPAKVGVPISDITSGLWVAISVLGGLLGRRQTGTGCYIDLSMMDVQASLLTIAASRFLLPGKLHIAPEQNILDVFHPLHSNVRTENGYILAQAISIGRHFARHYILMNWLLINVYIKTRREWHSGLK